jgi:small ligand-binding sensory domain FIST
LKQATHEAVNSALKRLDGRGPEAVIMIISASRYELTTAMGLDEREIVQEMVGPNTPLLGCVSEAEIGPITGTQPMLQTGSLVVALFG